MKVSTAEEMRRLDRTAIEKFGIADELLMENAGQAAYFILLNEFGVEGKKCVVLCGTGNNGGDGLVVARKIHSAGGEVRVCLLDDPGQFRGAAKKNFDRITRLPIPMKRVESVKSLRAEMAFCDVIVDAIFGTGLTRPVEGFYKDAIVAVNESAKSVLSLDIPSGISGNAGQVMGTAVRANWTVAFGLPKIGNVLYPGFAYGGKLAVSHISFPPSLYNADSLKIEINRPSSLPARDPNGYKGSFGDVLFIGGASTYFGAPYFSALSFLKAGGGYSRLAAPRSLIPFIASKGSEIVFDPQEETREGSMGIKSKDRLLELSEKVDMVVLGPGLSLHEETQELAKELARNIRKPLLIDGDGLTAVSQSGKILRERKEPTILTPHLGEMARIAKVSVSEIEKNKIAIVQKEAKRLNVLLVLKGAHSLIGYPDGRVFVNMSGNSGMATAGSGDVLTGTIAAMFGLGLSLEDSVRTGVFMHGFAGDLAAQEMGEDGITAQNILKMLPSAVKTYREKYGEIVQSCYHTIRTI